MLENRATRVDEAEKLAKEAAAEKGKDVQEIVLPPLTVQERVADVHLALVLRSVVMIKSMLTQHLCVVVPALITLVRLLLAMELYREVLIAKIGY